MARPRIELDKETFEMLCGLQCTQTEIATAMHTSPDTLARWCKREYGVGFAEVFSQKRENGKISLRRKQWQLAEKSATMAIWLGKQYLNQRDNVELTLTDKSLSADAKSDIDRLLEETKGVIV